MKTTKHPILLSTLFGALLLLMVPSFAFSSDKTYEVKVTNATKGLIFTPILVASHRAGVNLFRLGAPASSELEALAEGGAVGPLTEELLANPNVHYVVDSGGLLLPGESVSVLIDAPDGNNYLSLAAMLLPTNDAMVAVNGLLLPKGRMVKRVAALAYDAGTELNDELCVSIPGGGGCTGEGHNLAGGEGFVHVHAGIHDIGDITAADYDWRNPIAYVMIKRVKNLEN